MGLLGQETITRRRFATSGAYDGAGEWVPGAITDTPVQASVQELSRRELEQLPEAERQRDPIKLYTETTDWQLSDPTVPGQQSDHLLRGGLEYKVLSAGPRHPLIPHWKVTAVRLQEPG